MKRFKRHIAQQTNLSTGVPHNGSCQAVLPFWAFIYLAGIIICSVWMIAWALK